MSGSRGRRQGPRADAGMAWRIREVDAL